MPKVTIAEKDLTSAENIQYNDYIVLLPGRSLSLIDGEEIIVSTKDAFHKKAGEYTQESNKPISYKIAEYLLDLGMTIIFVQVDNLSSLESYTFWEKYSDKGLYDIRFIFSPELTDKAVAEHMIKCAAVRGDAVALVDIPDAPESGDVPFDADYIEKFIKSLVVVDVTRANGEVENAFKYAASFAHSFSFNGEENTWFPGSFGYLAAFAKHINRFRSWFAMAGSTRGVLPFGDVVVDHKFGTAEIDKLQDRETENSKAVNVITEIRPYGNIVWGNRTLYPLTRVDNTLGLRASNFLNIRNLCCDLKKLLFRESRRFTFDPNSDVLWVNFKSAIIPLLEEMKSGQGIKGYTITKVATPKKATLKAKITIIPIEAVEDFDLTVELADSIVVVE